MKKKRHVRFTLALTWQCKYSEVSQVDMGFFFFQTSLHINAKLTHKSNSYNKYCAASLFLAGLLSLQCLVKWKMKYHN